MVITRGLCALCEQTCSAAQLGGALFGRPSPLWTEALSCLRPCRRHSASLNSHTFMKKHSQILRAVNEYEKRHVIPDNPERLTELVGKV